MCKTDMHIDMRSFVPMYDFGDLAMYLLIYHIQLSGYLLMFIRVKSLYFWPFTHALLHLYICVQLFGFARLYPR